MAMKRALKTLNPTILIVLTSQSRHLNSFASAGQPEPDSPSSSFTFSSSETAPTSISNKDDNIYIKNPKKTGSSVTMPISFMTGSIVGGRFYEKLTTRDANDGNRWNVMLDYRTLKTPSKRPLNCSTLALAKAIAAEWEFQIWFCRAPRDSDLTSNVLERQVEKLDPLLNWVESEFGFKPIVYSRFFGGKQEEGLVDTIENLLKKTDDYELATIDAIAASAHSLVIALGIFCGRLDIEQAIELIRLEEDLQVGRWGLVEGGLDVDNADLQVQVSAATAFIGLSRKISY
ncbi:ATP synthase mitochondrial F1 complex assembly factor 2 [Olea europaea subsp. europaea]|uniref:ATP synthase mitochondrial F1 complex assembly factor 2 n=1 Tax=Olea europaea subsp. europaea TaxID=158383 RepID=A0A8S0V128_OLEEU|nr:ATP synthase mitochondrial F1 complex assembly factor 2 [Olea europaea subsp. europaea]